MVISSWDLLFFQSRPDFNYVCLLRFIITVVIVRRTYVAVKSTQDFENRRRADCEPRVDVEEFHHSAIP
jgi:hypothetical protein